MGEKLQRSILVYVAGPLGEPDGWHETVPEAIHAGDRLMCMHERVVAYVPHSHGATWSRYVERDYEWWMEHCLVMVSRCHALLRIPGHSSGADREVAHAHRLGIPVFHSAANLVAYIDRVWAHSPCATEGGSSSQPPPSEPDAAPPHASGDVVATGRETVATSTARANSSGGTRDHARAQSLPGPEVRNPEGQGAAPLRGPSCWHCGGTGHLGIHCPKRPAWRPVPSVAETVSRVRELKVRGGR